MKIISIILLLFVLLCNDSNKKYIGSFHDQFGSKITLNADSTYHYSWQLCLANNWINGKWTTHSDTILLQPILIFDTLSYFDSLQHTMIDSMVLSEDEYTNKIELKNYIVIGGEPNCQNCYGSPKKLFYKDDKLYNINNNGEIDTRRMKGFITKNKEYPTYYIRDKD